MTEVVTIFFDDAMKYGSDGAIFLAVCREEFEKRRITYGIGDYCPMSLEDWQECFPFWKISKIHTLIAMMKKEGIIHEFTCRKVSENPCYEFVEQ